MYTCDLVCNVIGNRFSDNYPSLPSPCSKERGMLIRASTTGAEGVGQLSKHPEYWTNHFVVCNSKLRSFSNN